MKISKFFIKNIDTDIRKNGQNGQNIDIFQYFKTPIAGFQCDEFMCDTNGICDHCPPNQPDDDCEPNRGDIFKRMILQTIKQK
jgi:hypothetical protein